MIKTVKKGKYLHSKSGNYYEVLGVATHSETRELLVVYINLYEDPEYPIGSFWVRPLEMFTEEVEINGKKMPRFKYIGEK